MSNTGSTLATHPSMNLAVVGFGVLLMWLSWADYEWFAYLLWTPRRMMWGFMRDANREEAEWDRLKMRILAFLVGLGLVIWQVGLVLGLWASPQHR